MLAQLDRITPSLQSACACFIGHTESVQALSHLFNVSFYITLTMITQLWALG